MFCNRHPVGAFGTSPAVLNGCFAALTPSWLLPGPPFCLLLLASPTVRSILSFFRVWMRSSWQKSFARPSRSEEHTSELQSHSDLHSFPTRRSSDLTVLLVAARIANRPLHPVFF